LKTGLYLVIHDIRFGVQWHPTTELCLLFPALQSIAINRSQSPAMRSLALLFAKWVTLSVFAETLSLIACSFQNRCSAHDVVSQVAKVEQERT
jgi:hypothetical protein